MHSLTIKHLLSIELHNFKSFNQTHQIGPFLNFTSIIGPNGVGKSNIIDAICFVLDVSLRTLRTPFLKELIFRKPLEMSK